MGILDYFGLMTKKDFQAQMEALKREFMPYEQWQLLTAEAERWNLPDPSVWANQANLFRRLPAIFTSIDIVASASALTEFSVARVIQEREPKDIPNHPFEILLAHPNPLDSRFEFLYGTIAFWMLNKNAYWWLNRADEFSPPEEIWVIPPHMIQPIPDERMFLRGYYYYPGNGAELFLPPEQIIHFKGFNPFSRFVGMSAGIESLMLLAQSYLGMTAWNTKLYQKSNGRLPSMMTFENMIADPTWEKIKKETREAADNREILMLRGVGQNGGVNWIQNTSNQKDMEFYTGLDAIDKKIMDVLAPGAYTMLYENANEANSRTGRATLNELAVYPKHVVMGEKITSGILPAYGSDKARPLVGHFKDIRVTDRQLEITEQQEYSKTHTIAEIREEFYGDDPLGDERDELLPEQIKPESGGVQEPPAPPTPPVIPGQQQGNPQQEITATTNNPPADQQPPTNKAALDEILQWERKSNRIGAKAAALDTAQGFMCIHISSEISDEIRKALPECKTETAVKMVFEKARAKIKQPKVISITPVPQYNDDALITLAQSLNNLAASYKSQAVQTPSLPNIYLPSQTFNLPPAENTYNITMPNQDAPQTHVNITPTIEAAKSPDVQISNPVTIHQTVEPAAAPLVTTPISINQTIEPEAATVNVNVPEAITNVAIENRLPDQPAPNVTIENKVEPTPVKFDPTITTPAPNVTVVNEVKTPKIKRVKERKQVERDAGDNIDSTTATSEYEYDDE